MSIVTIASFEIDGVRHIIMGEPTDRSGIADTFCGQQFERSGPGYCYVGVPKRSEACPWCVLRAEEIVQKIDR